MPINFNLPRVQFATVDNQLVPITDLPLTESLLIVGPALDGPTDRVVQINNVGEIERIYGPVTFNTNYSGPSGQITGYSGNAVMKAVREVQSGGVADIRIMRVGGSLASGAFTMPSVLNVGASGTITVTARFNGRIYNQVTVSFTSGSTSGQIVIGQPIVKGGNLTIQYAGVTSGATIGNVIDQVNSHPLNSTVKLSVGSISSTAPARVLQGTATLAGGTDGTIFDDNAANKTKMYSDLTDATTGTFVLLADTSVDNIYLTGIYLDDMVVSGDATRSIAQDFSTFLGQRTADSPMLGFIGVKPLDDFSSRTKVNAHFNTLMNPTASFRATNWTTAGYFMNNGFIFSDGTLNQPIDAGGYLQVVAADVLINDPNLGIYTETAAGIYAGTVAALRPHQAATHQRVNGIFGLPYEFTRAQLNTLVGGVGANPLLNLDGQGAYLTVQRIDGIGVLFTKDVTASNRTSDFKLLQPLRIANAAHHGIAAIAFPYLGKENSQAMRNSLLSAIKAFLDNMANAGALLGTDGVGYFVDLQGGVTQSDRLLGTLRINVMLRPNFQIQLITVTVRLSL